MIITQNLQLSRARIREKDDNPRGSLEHGMPKVNEIVAWDVSTRKGARTEDGLRGSQSRRHGINEAAPPAPAY